MAKKNKKGLKLFLKLGVTALAIWYLTTKIDVSNIITKFSEANYAWVLLAALLFALSKVLSAYRLQYFLRPVEVNITNKQNLKLYIIGMFYNVFLPGGIGGDGYKVWFLKQKFDVKTKKLIWAMVLDRAAGMLMLVVTALLCTLYFELPHGISDWLWTLIPLGLLAYWLLLKLFFKTYLSAYLPAVIYSGILQVVQGVCGYCILKGLHIEEGYFQLIFVFLISAIVLMIPLPSLGGLGIRENVIKPLAGAIAINETMAAQIPDQGVQLSLMFYLISIAVSFFGIYFHFRNDKILD